MQNSLLFIFGMGTPESVLLLLIGSLWVYSLVKVLRSDFTSDLTRVFWFVIVLFFPLIGSMVYLLLDEKTRSFKL